MQLNSQAGNRSCFKECYIAGVVDFIFGAGRGAFYNCIIYPRFRRNGGSGGYLTATNTRAGQAHGFVFRNCIIPKKSGTTTYTLGPVVAECPGLAGRPLAYPLPRRLAESHHEQLHKNPWVGRCEKQERLTSQGACITVYLLLSQRVAMVGYAPGTQQPTLDLHGLAAGAYLVRYTSGAEQFALPLHKE